MGAKFFGAAVKRREDPRFLLGEGRFVDDVTVPGMLHSSFLRSPHAHAHIVKIDTTAASASPGVVRVLTFKDLERWMTPLPLFGAVPPGLAAVVKFEIRQAPQWALCRERARYVGEIVAMVVADSAERAEDAVDLIEVEWDRLPPVVDMTRAAEPGATLIHPEWGSNVGIGFTHSIGDADRAFAQADAIVAETFNIQRYVGMPLEGRGVVAAWDRRDGTMTTWNSTQVSHFVQQGLTGALGLPPHKIRVIAPDLGGGFGTKASGYAEDALVPIAATVLGRPVKWIEDRRRSEEHTSELQSPCNLVCRLLLEKKKMQRQGLAGDQDRLRCMLQLNATMSHVRAGLGSAVYFLVVTQFSYQMDLQGHREPTLDDI